MEIMIIYPRFFPQLLLTFNADLTLLYETARFASYLMQDTYQCTRKRKLIKSRESSSQVTLSAHSHKSALLLNIRHWAPVFGCSVESLLCIFENNIYRFRYDNVSSTESSLDPDNLVAFIVFCNTCPIRCCGKEKRCADVDGRPR